MWRPILALLLSLTACEGPPGPRGLPGRDAPLDAEAAAEDAETDSAQEMVDAAEDSGDATEDASAGLSGVVRDPIGRPLQSGSVVLVPKERVAALSRTPLDLSLSAAQAAAAENDEPLEDLVRAANETAVSAISDAGQFQFEQVPEGDQFVVFVPAADDALHLPGGQLARTPFAADALRGATLELRVSGAPSASARYVGSGPCLNCHGRHGLFASAHALTLRVPGINTAQQDTRSAPRIDEALSAFASASTLYFTACQTASAELASCTVTDRAPSAPADIRLSVRLGRDDTQARTSPGHYFVELAAANGPAQRYPVVLALGGTRSLQQFVARLPLAGGGYTHFLLPFAYQLQGDDARPSFADFRWVSYRIDDWLDLGAGTLRVPSHARAFERECAGCHTTGFSARGSEAQGFRGSAVASADGSYDLDGDGRTEELAVGCESCHGPGSEHIETTPRGLRIVSPSLLTPERKSMLCGGCHARHRGKHDELAPLDDALAMPRAGLSRSAFLTRHVSRIEAGPAEVFPSGDSRLSFAQYADFLRSPKYRSPELLVSCDDCHDAHRSQGFASDLRHADESAGCTACHRSENDVARHVTASVRFPHDVGVRRELLTCTRCHMVPTARAGARIPALRDVTDADPQRHQVYYHGDRTSHRFVFTGRSYAAEQPVAITSGCAPCHGELLPVP